MKFKASLILIVCLTITAWSQEKGELTAPKDVLPEDRIAFTLYTVHDNILKLTAQFHIIKDFEPFRASLQIKKENVWEDVAQAEIVYPGYTAHFRVENWDDSRAHQYRVVHNDAAFYEGTIQKNPIHKDEFIVGSFSCNSIYPNHGGNISRQDIVDNIKKIQPDLLFFAGDQVYDHSEHYVHWIRFGADFGELLRNTPTVCIPDDHDIGQANLWGSGGKKGPTRHGEHGGYYMPVSYIQEVERAQTSHLPDPYDPTPIEQGIGVHYTHLNWGGISFAIIEDRKFKTGPNEIHHDPFSVTDTKELDDPKAVLLGQRQLDFLEDWSDDWKNAEMKAVLSGTIFSSASTASGWKENQLSFDLDTNGWPQSGRNRALKTIRKSFSCMLAGDQHLGSVIQHGVDEWGDAGYSFASPAIASYWLRWWKPTTQGINRKPGALPYTGDFEDGLGNKFTMAAVANPPTESDKESIGNVNARGAGYGVVRFNKSDRTITFECWARNVDVSDPKSRQYRGWPVTVAQEDNFRISKGYELPTLIISKEDQVVTVRNAETGELHSSLRINGKTYQPKVLDEGEYKIIIGEGDGAVHLTGKALVDNAKQTKVEIK